MSLKVIELFSGLGAYSKAMQRLDIDHEVILAVDHDKYPMTAYNAIHGTNFEPQDISTIDMEQFTEGMADIICYSPPCQAFSKAGNQEGFNDHRGILFFDALKIIEKVKPKYAIMENVDNLPKKFAKEYRVMLDSLEEIGYTNYDKVLNAKDYNVAQNRKRIFIVSIRNDIEQTFEFPKPLPMTKKLYEYLEEDATLPILHNIYGGFKEDSARVFEDYAPVIRTSAGGGHIPSVVVKGCSLRSRNYRNQAQQLEVREDNLSNAITTVQKDHMLAFKNIVEAGEENGKSGYKLVVRDHDVWKIREDDISTCLVASYHKGMDNHSARTAVLKDYHLIRMMTPLETFRLMSFDDEDYYKAREALNQTYYNGRDRSKSRLYRLAGNSIAVNVLEEIFKNLLTDYINTSYNVEEDK